MTNFICLNYLFMLSFLENMQAGFTAKTEAVLIATGCQIRADRAGLGWSQAKLAGRAGVHANAVA
jgi:hypothetical protein